MQGAKPLGTAFFIAPDLLLTCAHVVRSYSEGETVSIEFEEQLLTGTVQCKRPAVIEDEGPPWPFPDVAVIQLEAHVEVVPLRLSLRTPWAGDQLDGFGYPFEGNAGGEDLAPECGGLAYVTKRRNSAWQIRLIRETIRKGVSGGPLTLRGSAEVIAMLTDTVDRYSDRGGHATPTQFLLEECAELGEIEVINPPAPPSREIVTASDVSDALARSVPVPEPPISQQAPPDGDTEQPAVRVEHIQLLVQQSRSLRRQARPREANVVALSALNDEHFATMLDYDKATVLREVGVTYFERGQLSDAQSYCDAASQLDPGNPRQVIFEAELFSAQAGIEAALARLPERSVSEVEIFKAAYLIQLGRPKEALNLIRQLPADDQNVPRTRRLLILVYAALRERANMLIEAHAAWPHRNDDAQVAFVVAYAYILAVLSVPNWPPYPWSWPQPIPVDSTVPPQARRDSLQRAVEIFERQLAVGEFEGDQRATLEAWHFVALALDEENHEVASGLARSMLQADPPNYRVIPWIWALNLQIDVTPALNHLRKRMDAGIASPEEILILVIERLDNGSAIEARAMLERNEATFSDSSANATWHFLMLRVLIDSGDEDRAREHLAFMPPEQRQMAEMILIESHHGDESNTIPTLMRRYEESQDPLVLMLAAELAYRISDWNFLATFGEKLFAEFGNITSARYSIYGAYNLGRLEDALARVSDYAELVGSLPADLMRLRARILERLGDPNALAAYEAVINESPTADNFRAFAHFAASIGNYPLVVLIAQRLLKVESTPKIDLTIAQLVRAENPDVAKALWQRAMLRGSPEDELVRLAFTLAHELGLSAETASLQEPMRRLGLEGEHGIRLVAQEELITLLRDAREHSQSVMQLYRNGVIPIHMLCAATNATLISTHVLTPRANARASGDGGWDPLYVRHGSRPIESYDTRGGVIYLDVTSVLVASDLGVFDDILSVWEQIYISSELVSMLGYYRDRLEPGQPQRLAALRRIIELASDGALEITGESVANLTNIAIVDWAPNVTTPHHQTPRRLVNTLRATGIITDAQHETAVRALGSIQDDLGNDLDELGSIVFAFNTIEPIQEGGILEALLASRRVLIERRYLDVIQQEVRTAIDEQAAATWTASLIENLRRGQESGKIRTVTANVVNAEVGNRLEIRELMDAFAQMPESALIVADDRFVTAYTRREDGIAVLSLSDLLASMHAAERLTERRYFSLLSELRGRGFLFIPLLAAELLHHVRESLRSDGIVPTRELRTLERYMAFALLDKDGLNGPEGEGTPPGNRQAAFIVQSGAALRDAIRTIISEDEESATAAASWLRDHFTVDGLPGYGADGFGPSQPRSAIDVEGANYLTDWAATEWRSQ